MGHHDIIELEGKRKKEKKECRLLEWQQDWKEGAVNCSANCIQNGLVFVPA